MWFGQIPEVEAVIFKHSTILFKVKKLNLVLILAHLSKENDFACALKSLTSCRYFFHVDEVCVAVHYEHFIVQPSVDFSWCLALFID